MSSTTIQIRINEKEKRAAQNVLNKLGLDMSSAIKMFFRQIALRKGLPFLALTENGFTPAEEEEILKAAQEAKKGVNVSSPMSPKEFFTHLKRLSR